MKAESAAGQPWALVNYPSLFRSSSETAAPHKYLAGLHSNSFGAIQSDRCLLLPKCLIRFSRQLRKILYHASGRISIPGGARKPSARLSA